MPRGPDKKRYRYFKDIQGRKFGKWLVISYQGTIKNGSHTWLCQCDCGNMSLVIHANLHGSHSKKCEACGHLQARKEYPQGEIPIPLWNAWKRQKKDRFPLEITREFAYQKLAQQNFRCALSGTLIWLPANPRDTVTASLDRIDSTKGYTKDNIQWLHKNVNLMKNVFDEDHFIHMCLSVGSFGGMRKFNALQNLIDQDE